MRYIGIKVKGLRTWLWFRIENVAEGGGRFKGEGGWGKSGNNAAIDISLEQIEGRIVANSLQGFN